MAETNMRVTNWPESGSPERVAFELYHFTRGALPPKTGVESIKINLALYAQCLNATSRRPVDTSGLT